MHFGGPTRDGRVRLERRVVDRRDAVDYSAVASKDRMVPSRYRRDISADVVHDEGPPKSVLEWFGSEPWISKAG